MPAAVVLYTLDMLPPGRQIMILPEMQVLVLLNEKGVQTRWHLTLEERIVALALLDQALGVRPVCSFLGLRKTLARLCGRSVEMCNELVVSAIRSVGDKFSLFDLCIIERQAGRNTLYVVTSANEKGDMLCKECPCVK